MNRHNALRATVLIVIATMLSSCASLARPGGTTARARAVKHK